MTAFRATLPYRSYRFVGEDSLTFLQGQLTQDISLITRNRCHYGAFCNVKGRMLANFLIRPTPNTQPNDYILRLHEGQADAAVKRLQMFILRAKVKIEALSLQHVGLNKIAAKTICGDADVTLPDAFHSVDVDENVVLCALPNDYFELILSDSSPVKALLSNITDSLNDIETLRLQGGHFNVLPETNELLLPQQTPLEAWGGINYQKGCYVGQEVIARNKYLGKVKKGLAYASLQSANELTLPATVQQENKLVGQIIEAHTGKQHTACLGLLSKAAFTQPVTVNDTAIADGFVPIIE